MVSVCLILKEQLDLRLEMLDIKSPNPPGVAFIAALLLIYFGYMTNNGMMVFAGWIFVGVGVLLQLLYLRYRYGKLRSSTEDPRRR